MKLYDTGVYLLNGKEIVPETEAKLSVSREKAAENTIAYSILKSHNTSGNMEKLQIKFDPVIHILMPRVPWKVCVTPFRGISLLFAPFSVTGFLLFRIGT